MKPGADFSRAVIAAQSGRSKTSSAFDRAISSLVLKGLVSKASADRIGLASKDGKIVNVDHLVKSGPTGIQGWLTKLAGTEKAFLEVLLRHAEESSTWELTKEELCQRAVPPRSPSSSGVDTAIRKLVSLGLAAKAGKLVKLNPEHTNG